MYENVFEPIQVAGVTIPNRIVRTAHGTQLRMPTPESPRGGGLLTYHEARARGGVGLSILEAESVHPTQQLQNIPLSSDDVIWGYERISEAVHKYGMKLFQQLWYGGHTAPQVNGTSPWAPSAVPNPASGIVPIEMTKSMIEDLIAAYASAAARVKRGGLDGVEVHAAHGYLPAQFFSRAINHRTDEYGGELENRVRFCIQVVQAIKAEVGADFPVGVRIVADEEYDGGLRVPDSVEIAKLLEPHIDYLNVSVGSYYEFPKMLMTMDEPLGYELPKTGVVAAAVSRVPRLLMGRIMTIEHASRIISEGTADMVGMVRATIADPDLVKKSREGRAAEVRPCIGSSQGCVGGGAHVHCVVNPSAGYEDTVPDTFEPTGHRQKFLVAGGGPAGLEAARTLALGGHDVTVVEMTGKLGGQVEIAASAPYRSDYGAITRWLADELNRLGVKVRLRTFVEPDLVAELAPDAVIVATGSTPRRDGFQVTRPALTLPGVKLPHVYTVWDVFGFGGRAKVGQHAVVYDDTGSYESINVCDQLLEAGATVTLVTRFDRFPARVDGSSSYVDMTALPARERLLANERFDVIRDSYLVEITPNDVEVRLIHPTAKTSQRLVADTVVMIGYNEPNRELADALADTGLPIYIVGDASGKRTLKAAIHDANALGRTLVADGAKGALV